MLFSQLPGNTAAKKILQRLIDTHALPPVLLFHGPGNDKQHFAEELAWHLLHTTARKDHPDLHTFFPEGSGLHSIASIRNLIEETFLPPFAAKAKIYLVHDAEKMLPTSSNALLKILEEPPAATWVILLATDVSAILPTVFSRCRPIAFHTPSLIPKRDEDPRVELIIRMLSTGLLQGKTSGFEELQRLEELLKEGEKEEAADRKGEELLSIFLYWIRDLCLLQAGGSRENAYYQDHLEVLERQALEMQPIPFLRLYTLTLRAHARLASHVRLISVIEECMLIMSRLA